MATTTRQIIEIDEELCDGCGLCIPSCAEGALQMVDGKAKLVSDSLCDGIGNCLGECPQEAIRVIEREAAEYDEKHVEQHLEQLRRKQQGREQDRPVAGGCPGAASRMFAPAAEPAAESAEGSQIRSRLRNWPVELMLVPEQAPYYDDADLLISADCVPFAEPNFHRELLDGRVLMIACPKLDNAQFYVEKLGRILGQNNIRSVTVAFMEVPCCFGLVHVVKQAIEQSGSSIDGRAVRVGIQGGTDSEINLRELPF
jgi:Fe-S-cluster-containing hydrogenase component 2